VLGVGGGASVAGDQEPPDFMAAAVSSAKRTRVSAMAGSLWTACRVAMDCASCFWTMAFKGDSKGSMVRVAGMIELG
jgi:hypothetical protein